MKLLRNGFVVLVVMFTFGASPVWADDDDDDDDYDTNKATGSYVSLLQVALEVNSDGPFAGSFDTLIAAVLKAEPSIVINLSKRTQRTVFAPTDEAFLTLGLDETNIDSLPQDVLTKILKYHIVRGRLLAEDVLDKRRLNTLLRGRKGFVRQNGGVLTDNLNRQSTIVVTNVEAGNGIIHVINGVLLPFNPSP